MSTPKKTEMPPDVRRRLFDIRCRSKEGRAVSDEERRFYSMCFDKWPEEYKAMEKDVFDATKPFGSSR